MTSQVASLFRRSNRTGLGDARALAACAGFAIATGGFVQAAWAQIAPQPAVGGVGAPAAEGNAQRPYVDEALFAKEALAKAAQLDDAGNRIEAVRIVQDILEREGEQLLAREEDRDLWVCVRERVHELLVARPALLEKYVLEQSARASALLEAGELAEVERTRFLTPAGLEAVLRMAQLDVEAGRFSSAELNLQRAATHPAAQREQKSREALAQTLEASKASVMLPVAGKERRVASVSSLSSFAANLPSGTPQTPLRSLALSQESARVTMRQRVRWGEQAESTAWVFPTVVGEKLFINDGSGIIAADAATLSPLWRTNAVQAQAGLVNDDNLMYMMGDRTLDDGAFVATGSGVAVAALGRPISGQRIGDSRVIAVRMSDGSELWSLEPRWADQRLAEGFVRGAPLIDSDVVVLGVRKPGLSRRITTLYLVGVDLFTGDVRYVRSVGSVGTQPWSRVQDRVDGGVIENGVVYRGDELGVLGAFDAHTGRPLWVRSFALAKPADPMESRTARPNVKAFEVSQPLVVGESVFFIEPGEYGVVQIEKRTGKLIAARTGEEMGSPRYLVRAGETLLCVGRYSITAMPLAEFATAVPKGLGAISSEGFVGRAIVTKDHVLLPVASGILQMDIATLLADRSANPSAPLGGVKPAEENGQAAAGRVGEYPILPLTVSGNAVLVGGGMGGAAESAQGHLLMADSRGVSSFLSWERAKEQLTARMAKSPKDPGPVLTLLELSLRMGQHAGVPALADKVLDVSRGLGGASTRARLFASLSEVLAVSRRAPAARSAVEDAGKVAAAPGNTPQSQALMQSRLSMVEQPPPAIEDKVLLEAIAQRLLPAADEAWQRTIAQLELSLAQDGLGKGKEAIATAQQVLLDPVLASVDFSLVGRGPQSASTEATSWGEPGKSIARDIASDLLWSLVNKHGAASYGVFEDQALEAVRVARAQKDVVQRTQMLVAAAAAYPCATASVDALESAASDLANQADARMLLGEALARVLRHTGARGEERLARLVSTLERKSEGELDVQPMARLLAKLARDYPALKVESSAGSLVLSELAQRWQERAVQRTSSAPLLTNELTEPSAKAATAARGEKDPLLLLRGDGLPQVMPGWDVREALVVDRASSADVFVAFDARAKVMGAFARSALSGKVEALWQRPGTGDGIVVHTSNARTLVFWPSEGGVLEAIDNASGLAVWTAQRMKELRDADAKAKALRELWPDRFSTPLGGSVRPDDVLIALTGTTCTLVERGGFAASFSLDDGKLLAAVQTPLVVVYDIDAQSASPRGAGETAGTIAMSGAKSSVTAAGPAGPGRSLGRLIASACTLDATTLSTQMIAMPEQIGEHARWVRLLGDGSMLLASAEGVQRLSRTVNADASANTMWQKHDPNLSYSVAGYVVGESLFALDTDLKLWKVNLADGKIAADAQLDSRDRISIPFEALTLGEQGAGGIVFASSRGVVAHAPTGRLMGVDALQAGGRLEPALLAQQLGAAGNEAAERRRMIVTVESGQRNENSLRPATPARVVFLRAPDLSLVGETSVGLPDVPTSFVLRDGLVIVGQEAGLVVLRAGAE